MRRIKLTFGRNGGPLDQDAPYRCAFITMQGVPTRYGKDRCEVGVTAIKALRRRFADRDRPKRKMLGRLRVV